MTLLPTLLSLLGALVAIVLLIVPYVTRPAALEVNGESQAVMAGGMLSFLLVAGVLYLLNPDHLGAIRPRAVEAAALAGFASVVWLPVYLTAVKARMRRRR